MLLRKVGVLGSVIALLGMLPLALNVRTAIADEVLVADPTGDGNPDVVSVSHLHSSRQGDPRTLVHEVTFSEGSSSAEIERVTIRVWLPDGDRSDDREIAIERNADGSFMTAVLGARGIRGYGNTYWKDGSTLRTEFTRSSLATGLRRYKWNVRVFFQCPPAEQDACGDGMTEDLAPNAGRLTHIL